MSIPLRLQRPLAVRVGEARGGSPLLVLACGRGGLAVVRRRPTTRCSESPDSDAERDPESPSKLGSARGDLPPAAAAPRAAGAWRQHRSTRMACSFGVCACVCVCSWACARVWLSTCMCLYAFVFVCVCLPAQARVPACGRVHACLYVRVRGREMTPCRTFDIRSSTVLF